MIIYKFLFVHSFIHGAMGPCFPDQSCYTGVKEADVNFILIDLSSQPHWTLDFFILYYLAFKEELLGSYLTLNFSKQE